MNKEVTERVNTIKKGNIPDGYKKSSKVGIIPKEWTELKFNECITISNGQVDPRVEPYINMKHIGLGNIEKMTGRLLYTKLAKEEDLSSGKYYFDKDTVLYGKIRPELGKVLYVDFEGICSADIYPLKPQSSMEVRYLQHSLMDKRFYQFAVSISKRTGMPKVNREDLSAYTFAIPSNNEQKKITSILSSWDKAIELKEKLLQQKQKQKKGLMERLLTGKVRLKGFNGEVKYKSLKSYIEESKRKNKDCSEERILSVTNNRGFILQEEQFERVVASNDLSNYKVVVNGQFAYNPSRINVGSIDLLTKYDSGLLSPMYVVFDVKEGLVREYLFQFLKSSSFLNYIPRLLQGSVRDSLSFDALQLVKLFIPTIEEQQAIAGVLSTADKEIELLETELEALKQQKKGLMQLLLTGIVRVKCD